MNDIPINLTSAEDVNAISAGFMKHNNIHIIEIGHGYCSGDVDLTEESMNHLGIPHGGIIYSLADTVCGIATGCLEPPYCVTASSNMYFLKPSKGSKIIARANRVKKGQSLSVVDVDIYDEFENHVAHGTFQFAMLK